MTKDILCVMMNLVMENLTETNKITNYNSPMMYRIEKDETLGLESMIKRSAVPASHKRIADTYMFIKKMNGSFMTYSQITVHERELLSKFDFAPLEYSTPNQIKDEIEFLKKWSSFQDEKMSKTADEILQIRVKELKNIISNRYVFITNEIYTGFTVLEQYLENISRY